MTTKEIQTQKMIFSSRLQQRSKFTFVFVVAVIALRCHQCHSTTSYYNSLVIVVAIAVRR